jgi:hypothetical protein
MNKKKVYVDVSWSMVRSNVYLETSSYQNFQYSVLLVLETRDPLTRSIFSL